MKITLKRQKERFVERPLWIATFLTAEGKEQMVSGSIKELGQMIKARFPEVK